MVVLLIYKKKIILKFIDRIPSVIRYIYTLAIVIGGWALFYFTDMSKLKGFMIAALGRNTGANSIIVKEQLLSHIWIIILMFICSTPIVKITAKYIKNRLPRLYAVLLPIIVVAVMIVSFALLVKQSYNPFLYFRF